MWYYNSNLYRNFTEDEEIPIFEEKVTKPDTSINSIEDLIWLLNTMTFWDYTGKIPEDIFIYAYNTKDLKITIDLPEYSVLFNVLELISQHKFKEALEDNYLFETFKFLVDLRPKNLDKTYYCTYAAENDRLDCLIYAHENECYWNAWICICTAGTGYLDCLKYAHEHGCPWNKWVCIFTVQYGQLDCLKYAHEHDCPWDKEVCYYAAQFGYLDCLKYAHENGCPWNKEECLRAAKNDQIRNYLHIH